MLPATGSGVRWGGRCLVPCVRVFKAKAPDIMGSTSPHGQDSSSRDCASGSSSLGIFSTAQLAQLCLPGGQACPR